MSGERSDGARIMCRKNRGKSTHRIDVSIQSTCTTGNGAHATMRHPDDKPTIGLLLCRSKDRIVVEYALRDLKKPIGVAGWETKIVEKLPENLKGSLPTVEELEAELSREENER